MDAEESQIFNAIIIAGLVLGMIIIFFVISVVKQQKKVVEMQRKNISAEVKALENDRARIARDIHDDIAPMLVAVKMRISSFDMEEPEEAEQVEQTNEVIDDISKRLRAISFDLMPSSLKYKGLQRALLEFAAHINRGKQINLQMEVPDEALEFDDQRVIHIYRIVQEIVQNAIKHSGASEVYIKLEKRKKNLVLQTKDNGSGFDFEKAMKGSSGLGLRSMLNRIDLLRGSYNVESGEGKGTAYTIEIPTDDEPTI